jgi:hypothetical protein
MAMKSPHILLAGNLNKLKLNIANVIDATAMHAIEEEICINAAELYFLGKLTIYLQFVRITVRGARKYLDFIMVHTMYREQFGFV